jgi:putative (di)nucleoside polyphosphate hydrolase
MNRRKSPAAAVELPYRDGVGVVLFNRQGQVFVGRRIDQVAEAWQLPQGGIDPGETPRQAALRELREEIGTADAEIVAESRDWLTYDLPAAIRAQVWQGRFRGQRQKWFAARFLGPDSAIDLATHHPEFNAWKWAALADLPKLGVAFKRAIYKRLVAEFGHLAAPAIDTTD